MFLPHEFSIFFFKKKGSETFGPHCIRVFQILSLKKTVAVSIL